MNNTQNKGVIESNQITMVPLSQLYEFRNHPFRICDDEKMTQMVESIRSYGVLIPGIARPRFGGGYELIAGHRRKRASEKVGKAEMPVVVRDYTDDEAVIIMVDSNIQREDVLPSEKAKAYKMKYEAMKHQGRKTGKKTLDEVGRVARENAKKVQRYIWLARLSDGLLDLVDHKKIGLSQGVDLSFLSTESQRWVEEIIKERGCNVSTTQSRALKEYQKNGELTPNVARAILVTKRNKDRKVTIRYNKIEKYFSPNYTNKEIENIIMSLLDKWKAEKNM